MTAAQSDEDITAERLDLEKLYCQFCSEVPCRVNSAVLRTLRQDPHRPLTSLALSSNYVGAKGFTPILRLIDRCQTVEHLDLAGNGLSNEAVVKLCDVLKRHLGIRTVNLSDNPITLDGGKAIMSLIEANRQVVDVSIEGTDIFFSLADRISMGTDENFRHSNTKVPRLNVARPSSSPAATKKAAVKPTITKVPLHRPSTAATSTASEFQTPHPPRVPERPATSGTASKGRPPPPAIASLEATRMSDARREDLRQRFKKRQEMYSMIDDRSESSRAADVARHELALLETAEKRKLRPSSTGLPTRQSRSASWTEHVALQQKESSGEVPPAQDEKPQPPARDAPTPPDNTEAPPAVEVPAKATPTTETEKVAEEPVPKPPAETIESEAAKELEMPERTSPRAADLADAPIGGGLVAVAAEDQFRVLFNLGCKQYNEKQFEGAYITWQEAMELASAEKNREWMAIIAQNLRRLSFELLASEGMKQLQAGKLDEADNAFSQALETATRASNAAWEAEMRRAKKNVLHAKFQKSHKDATALIDQLKSHIDEEVTSDTKVLQSGAVRIEGGSPLEVDTPGELGADEVPQRQRRTSAFFNEWNKMLLLKEAMELWTDGRAIARLIGGSSAKVLEKVVQSAVGDTALWKWERSLTPNDDRRTLPMLRCVEYTYEEAKQLFTLWGDLFAKTKVLEIPEWTCLCYCYLGHLALATHQLPSAVSAFENMLSVSGSNNIVLRSCAQVYLGIALWQRSDFGRAEGNLKDAAGGWDFIRRELSKKGSMGDGILQDSVPCTKAFAISMLTLANDMLVNTLLGAFRYREALEVVEKSLLHRHDDVLREKLMTNFAENPTADHIFAVAATMDSPLVFLSLAYRFEWNMDTDEYDADEQLLTWVVPKEGDIKFVQIEVTRDFKVPSIRKHIDSLRSALMVNPITNTTDGDGGEMYLKTPEIQWKYPLQQLYSIIIAPIVDFLDVHVAYNDCGVVTLIPTGILWLVPFNALMDNGAYMVERFAFVHAFSAAQLAFAALSATRVRVRDAKKRVVLGAPCETDMPSTTAPVELLFPLDVHRMQSEASEMVNILDGDLLSEGATNPVSLSSVLPQTRVAHITLPISSAAKTLSSRGGVCVAGQFDEISMWHASDLAQIEIPAELVSISNSNIVLPGFTLTDGTLEFFRAILNSGAASLIASAWCTADMVPAAAFSNFYHQCRSESHKARALAMSIRNQLIGDPLWNPRHWAGLMFIGVGEL